MQTAYRACLSVFAQSCQLELLSVTLQRVKKAGMATFFLKSSNTADFIRGERKGVSEMRGKAYLHLCLKWQFK